MCIAVQHIDCIVFRNLLEMNDVPEIPAYTEESAYTLNCRLATYLASSHERSSFGKHPAYYSGGRSRKSTLSCFSLENLPHCCETLTTVAAQFQDAASTGASLIPAFVQPVSHLSAPPPEPPNVACTIPTPLPRLSRAGQTHAEFAGCPSHTRRGPFTRLGRRS